MRFPTVATDRIAASAAASYGLFWVIVLVASMTGRTSFRPNNIAYFAAGIAVTYVMVCILVLFRIRVAARLLQITTLVITLLALTAFGMEFMKEGFFQRVLLVAFAQLQVAYAASVCLLLGHTCQPVQKQVEAGDDAA